MGKTKKGTLLYILIEDSGPEMLFNRFSFNRFRATLIEGVVPEEWAAVLPDPGFGSTPGEAVDELIEYIREEESKGEEDG